MRESKILENVEVDKRGMNFSIKGLSNKQKMSDTIKCALAIVEHTEQAGEITAEVRIQRLGEVVILQEPKI